MGIQDVDDVTLIRHAYVAPERQGRASAAACSPTSRACRTAAAHRHLGRRRLGGPLLRAARLPARDAEEKDRLLRRYWRIPERQVETSVVLRYLASPSPQNTRA